MTMKYLNPMWHAYNEGLTRITDNGRGAGPLIAKGCGHFIQKDDPDFVVLLLANMLHKITRVSIVKQLSYPCQRLRVKN